MSTDPFCRQHVLTAWLVAVACGVAKRSKVQLYEQIRRAHAAQETKSIRTLSRQFRVHRRDVRAALDSAVPPSRKTPERPAPKMDQWKPIIDGWLTEDQKWPR